MRINGPIVGSVLLITCLLGNFESKVIAEAQPMQWLRGFHAANWSLGGKPAPNSYLQLYSFQGGSDGMYPAGGLLAFDGSLFGATLEGGVDNYGTVFDVSASGKERIVSDFPSPNGQHPIGTLIDVQGELYGTTSGGGGAGSGAGTVFKVDSSGKERVIHNFGVGNDGAVPESGLINVAGTLYGTTSSGGDANHGTVFGISTSGKESVVYSFKGGMDGANPQAALTYVNGKFYGTTFEGGNVGGGTVFEVSVAGRERVLHSFGSGSDGDEPYASLIALGGKLYGTTSVGGASHHESGGGTVFEINPADMGSERVLHSFNGGRDGAQPIAPLTDVNGELYGTTQYGGLFDSGTVFKISTSGTERIVYMFQDESDGKEPIAGLLKMNGALYGTTAFGGTANLGTVFEVSL